jgi:hypothetical protein
MDTLQTAIGRSVRVLFRSAEYLDKLTMVLSEDHVEDSTQVFFRITASVLAHKGRRRALLAS